MPIVLTNDPSSQHGGIQRYVARLASALADAGDRVSLIEPGPDTDKPDTRIDYRRFGGRGRLGAVLGAFASYASALVATKHKTTIASIWFPSGLIAAILPRPLRGKLGILAHGTEIAPSRTGLRRSLMRWTFARADVVFANSALTRRLLAEAGVTRNVRIALCGVDPKPLRRAPADTPTLLMVGRLVPRKGFDRTIEAMPAIVAAVPGARLRIVGGGSEREALVRLAQMNGSAPQVDFLGALDDERLADEYARAWCFAMPARRIADDVEGFGIVYLEAAVAGIASIGGLESGAVDAISDGETGMLVDGDDPTDIARAAIELLSDRTRAEALGKSARERALADFTWAKNAEIVRACLMNP